ncbi:MAG: glycosyltransferase [Monoglobales bacterium]
MNILFVMPTLGSGGAENALTQLVNSYSKLHCEDTITVLTLFDVGRYREQLATEVCYRYVFKKMFRGNIHIFKCFSPKFLYKHMIKKKYDLIVSYLEGPTTRIVSGCPENVILINWIHTSSTSENVLLKSYRSRNEYSTCMKKYNKTIFVAESAKELFTNTFPELGDLDMDVIYNPINDKEIRSKKTESVNCSFPDDTFNIVAVGRLSKVKGFDRLIRVCVKLKKIYNIRLYIIGGGEKSVLQKLIQENKADSYIKLLGYYENPYPLISQASLFVCSSYREGYSTSVIESLILGVPVVTTLCSGMKEILGSNNQYGLIVDNSEDGLYEGIVKMISKKEIYEYYRGEAIKRGQEFSLEKGVAAVSELFNKYYDRTIQ